MGKRFLLSTQQPHPEKKGIGVLSVDKKGDASFLAGDGERGCKVLANLSGTKIDYAAANGFMLSGFESCGFDSNGKMKYRYQEWWLAHEDGEG